MTNFLVFPEINDEHGFPPEVNKAIAESAEVQAEIDKRVFESAENLIINVMSKGVIPGTGPNGATSVTQALNNLFKTPGTYYFPAPSGTPLYLLDGTVTIGPNVNVICHPDAVFYLKNFVREIGAAHVHMFITDPMKVNGKITWTGGTINSNENNQYGQGGDGVNYDVFKGMIFQNAEKVALKNIKFRNQRGSAVEFWNLDHFVADDIEVQMLIPTIGSQKSGGYRRGGLTGSAKYVNINNVYGYAGDDLVCVAAGIDWGQPGKVRANVESAIITNIRPTEKINEPGRGTWTGVSAYAQNGYTFRNLVIDNVAGASQGSMIRVGSYAYGSDLPGTIDNDFHNVTISNISGYMLGYTLPDGLYNVGVVPSVAFISLPSLTCRNLIVSDVSMQMYANEIFDNPVISAGGSAIDKMAVSRVLFSSESTTVSDCPIFAQGSQGYVRELTFSECGHSYPKASSYGTRLIYRSTSSSTEVARVSYLDCYSGLDVGNVSPSINTSVVNGKITPMSDGIVMDFSNPSIVPAPLATFHDRASGIIAYRDGAWVTVQPRTFAYSVNSGKPTSGKWDVGFRVNTTGSPFASISGYICTDAGVFGTNTPVFRAIATPGASTAPATTPSAPITDFVPGATATSEIGGGGATGWPENLPGQVTTYRGLADIYSWQEYRPRQTTRLLRRYWDSNALNWLAWVEK